MIKEYTNSQLLEYVQSMIKVLPYAHGVTAFILNHNYKNIYSKIEDYMNTRNEIIEKYGELNEEGSYTIMESEKLEKANEELSAYSEILQSVDIVKVPESRMADSGLLAPQMMAISWMIMPSSSDDIRAALHIADEEEEAVANGSYDVTKPPEDF